MIRTGIGYDVHAFAEGRPLVSAELMVISLNSA